MNLHRVIKMGYLYFFLCPQFVMLSLDPCLGLLKNVIIILKVSLQQEVSNLVMGIALPWASELVDGAFLINKHFMCFQSFILFSK